MVILDSSERCGGELLSFIGLIRLPRLVDQDALTAVTILSLSLRSLLRLIS
jgi:hypothetical protein